MNRLRTLVRTIAIALTLSGLALGSLAASGVMHSNVLIADGSSQRGDWDPG